MSLSSLWASLTHKDTLYSRSFEQTTSTKGECTRLYGGVAAGPLYTQKVSYNSYTHAKTRLVAEPIKGDAGNYRMYQCTDQRYSNDADTGLAPRLRNHSPDHFKTPVGSVYTKDQALQQIKLTEEDWLKKGCIAYTKAAKRLP